MTRANGDIKDNVGRPVDNGQIGVVDPDTRLIGLHLYDGLLKVWLRIWLQPKGCMHAVLCMCHRHPCWFNQLSAWGIKHPSHVMTCTC